MGAALAYYTVFSLAPVLLLVITVTGLVVGDQPVRGELGRQLQDLLGPDTTRAIMDMMARAQQTSSGTIATVVSAVMLILGATGVFGELQDGLNTIFGVQAKPGRSMRVLIRDRLLSFGMILGIAFLLMVSLALSAVISALGKYAGGILGNRETFFRIANIVVSLALYTFLFAAIFKVLPDAKVRWRDAAIGALLTSVLFTIGRVLIGLYLGASSMASSFGAAGSLATILVWTYYSAQILYLGAELTRAYAELRGQQIVPNANAQWVPCAQEA
jgi:membrane protein